VGNLCRWSMPSGAAFTRMHSAQIGRRDCVTAPASWPSSRLALQLLARSHAHTPAVGTDPRRGRSGGRSPHARAWRCIDARSRQRSIWSGTYAVRCPHHTTALSHRPDRRWPLIASHRRQNRSMHAAAAMLPQHYGHWPAASPCGTVSGLALPFATLASTSPISHSIACLFSFAPRQR
jgi:hypothetical protein